MHSGSSDAVKFFLSGRGRTKGGASSKVSCDDWDKSQMSPIHYAAERGFDHVIEMLAEKGSDVNVRNGNGNTAMMLAAKAGFPGTIGVLFRLNADLLAKNAGGQTAAHFAIQADQVWATLLSCASTFQTDNFHSQVECLKRLVENFTEKLLSAIARAEELEALAVQGGGVAMMVNMEDADDDKGVGSEGKTMSGNAMDETVAELQELQELIKMQPESILDMASLSGARPIHLCGEFGALKCLKYLLSLGLDPNSLDNIGESPLHKAARKSHFDLYTTLKAAGAKEFIENCMRETPHQLLHDQTLY